MARSQFLLFKNVAMLFLATLWYLDATRKYFESSVVASTSVVFLPLIALFLEMNDYLQLDLPEEAAVVPEGHALARADCGRTFFHVLPDNGAVGQSLDDQIAATKLFQIEELEGDD